MTDAVKKYWKLTGFEFIDEPEFEKRRFDSKYSFLVLIRGFLDKDPEGISYNFLSLVLGDTAKDITNMPELCSIPVSYSGDNSVDYGYAVPSIIKFMQKHVKDLQEKHLRFRTFGLKYYDGILKLNDKTFLVNKNALAEDANSEEKIKKIYPYPFRLMTSSEIQKTLESNPANTVFNLHVGPVDDEPAGSCFEMIFDPDGNLYYYQYRPITNINKDGFNLANFEEIK